MKHEKHYSSTLSRFTGLQHCDMRAMFSSGSPASPKTRTNILADGPGTADHLLADGNLLDELQALFSRLGAAKILLTMYLVEFGGLPEPLAKPLLQEAAGSCAILRRPTPGHHLVIYLGPEPSEEAGGFLGRLRRGLTTLTPSTGANRTGANHARAECAWAEVRALRRCNHDVTEPMHLLLDLNAATPRVLGITDW